MFEVYQNYIIGIKFFSYNSDSVYALILFVDKWIWGNTIALRWMKCKNTKIKKYKGWSAEYRENVEVGGY